MEEWQEVDSLKEIFEVAKELMRFTGDIISQMTMGEHYTEQRELDAILRHIHSGGRAESEQVRIELSESFEERMQNARVPYVCFEITGEDDRKTRQYLFRDKDQAVVKELVQEMSLSDILDMKMPLPIMPEREIGITPER